MERFRFRIWTGHEMRGPFGVGELPALEPEWVLMQSTGLSCSTGEELFEGDLVEMRPLPILQVVWLNTLASFGCILADGALYRPTLGGYEQAMRLRGNIHEHAELFDPDTTDRLSISFSGGGRGT